jgi:dihydrofolate reductase
MRKLVLIVHTSLDGFVAGPNGELDGFDSGEENLEFVCGLTEGADACLFGRVSYQMLENYWPTARNHPQATNGEIRYSNWYNSARRYVVSTTLADLPVINTTVIATNIVNEIVRIKEQPGRDILIFGSPSVAQLLMKQNLIDDYWIFVNPVLFGKGIPLFRTLSDRIKLRLVSAKKLTNGEVALHYASDK